MEPSKTSLAVWEAFALTKGEFGAADTDKVRTMTSGVYLEMLDDKMRVDIHPDIWFQ